MHTTLRPARLWTPRIEARFLAFAPSQLRLVYILMAETGQRPADLLALTWEAYDGSHLNIRRRRNDRVIHLRVSPRLKAELDIALEARNGPTVLATRNGRPVTAASFATQWRNATRAAGLNGLTTRDLRHTAIVRLAKAGTPLLDIADFMGLDVKSVERIVDQRILLVMGMQPESSPRSPEPAPEIPN